MNNPFAKALLVLLSMITLYGCVNQTEKPRASELTKYGQVYAQLIQSRLDSPEAFQGKKCKLNIILTASGQIESVDSSGDENLCQASKNAISQIEAFPLPENKKTASELREIKLNINYM
ncbi:cell envelope integrity protein TolA [Vibrio fortis]|uniref:cell envelope integrity protein TolA n=1 Tax=Vibrio fortis TaxID=212667 RepID=UPI0038CD820F